MRFKPVNLRQELIRERNALQHKTARLLGDALQILNHASENDQLLIDRLRKPNYEAPEQMHLIKYDADRLFSSEEIRATCARYRLRFLDSSSFKKDFPYDALAETKRFEKDNHLTVSKFKMMAPPEMFNLEDRCKKDPLLFAQVGDNSYYLIHQWGTDLAWYRALIMWPLKNIYTFAQTLVLLSILLTFVVPLDWIIRRETHLEQIIYFRIAFFLHTIIFLVGFCLFLGMTFRKNFSVAEWDNPCFN
ncbi:MAG TPA: hypothetical protein VGO45_00270 [Bacteroidia bacterium]|jgi:hypothetical protein|nr:hypothetical protein [Bacteroidia bacterium]